MLSDGCVFCSQELHNVLFQISGLIDFRVTLDNKGVDSLEFEFIASRGDTVGQEMRQLLSDIPDIAQLIGSEGYSVRNFNMLMDFSPTHTLKRTILDTYYVKEMCNAVHS